ncbi:MAG: hypothetical protein ABID04_01415, partial [Patescibacteria group bacterium]
NGLELLPQTTPYQFGYFLPISLPFFLLGLFKLRKYFKQKANFVYFWLLVSPAMAALSRGGLSPYRCLATIAPFSIVIAVGFWSVWQKKGWLFRSVLVSAHLLFLGYFLVFYFNHFPVYSSENWQYGYKQMAQLIKPIYSEYDKIVIDPRFGPNVSYAGLPHLYIPYFTRLDPRALLARRVEAGGLLFDKYVIKDIDWASQAKEIGHRTIYILPEANLPPEELGLNLLETIYSSNIQPIFRVFVSE